MSDLKLKIAVSDSLKDAYNEQYTDEIKVWRELGAKYKAKNIVEVCQSLGKIESVLDVGAGEGSILMYLDEWQFCDALYAVEISESGIQKIKERNLPHLKEVLLFDGYHIPFDDNQFDVVILSHDLEHVEFPRLLLRELQRVSRYQVIEIPCEFSFNVDKRVEKFLSYGHINIYTPSLLRFLLKSEGFEILTGKLGPYAYEVLTFSEFINAKRPKNLKNMLRFHFRLLKKQLRTTLRRGGSKEAMADTYTVLCRKSDYSLKVF